MKVIIIEDEINNAELLTHLLVNYCNNITVCGVASTVGQGVKMVNNINPDLILLDVELEDGTGFDVLEQITHSDSKVIFITGYEHYAIKAIKMAAIDYILKPVNIEELKIAIAKAESISLEMNEISQLQQKVKELEPSYLWLTDTKKLQKVAVDSIEYIKADSVYSKVYLDKGLSRFTTFPLNHFEAELREIKFFRVHKSYLVNLAKVIEIESGRGGHLLMQSGMKLPIAYRRKTTLKRLLS